MSTIPATPRQLAYIDTLLNERPCTRDVENLWPEHVAALAKHEASRLITTLLAIPKETPAPVASAESTVEVGIGNYLLPDGRVYRVRKARQSTRLYCLRFDPTTTSFVYVGRGPLTFLRAEHAMTAEQAKEWGVTWGQCVNCGVGLEKDNSVYVGYGPVCAKRNGWFYPTDKQLREIIARSSQGALAVA